MSRLVAYALSVILLGATSLLSIPLMINASGIEPWAAAAVGQAVGSVAFVFLTWGWGVTGPAAVARAGSTHRRREYFESLRARSALLMVVLPSTAAITLATSRDHDTYAVLGALSTAVIGLSGNWYFTGTGQAWQLLGLETLPRLIGTVGGLAVMLVFSLPAYVCLLGIIVGGVIAVLTETVYVHLTVARDASRSLRCRPVRQVLTAQRHAASVGVLGAVYAALPVLLVSHLASSSLPLYAILDKIQKQIVTAMGPVFNVLQGWVPQAAAHQLAGRVRRAAVVGIILAFLCVAGFVAVGQELTEVISGSTVDVGLVAAAATGLASGLYMLDAIVGRAILVPLGLTDRLNHLTAVGSLVGLTAIACLCLTHGATGAMLGFSLGLAVKIAWGAVLARTDERVPVTSRRPAPQEAR